MRAYRYALFLNLKGISIFDETRGYSHLAFRWFRLHHVCTLQCKRSPTTWG